ncbi:MAG TPA: PAS domain S-box protein [Methanomicrobiales archaeon]|nr:PAS domain S-box protein [Methanomicrobiales archaeon]
MISLLVIDDEEEFLGIARHFLGKSGGIGLTTSTSSAEALELHRKQHFDAIIFDLTMPVLDGISFLKALRDSGDSTPFIILTGKGGEHAAADALNNGADFYLSKGGDPAALFAELERMVRLAVKAHRTEEALRESEQRYRTIFEITGSATAILDRAGIVLLANREAQTIFGYTQEELAAGIHWSTFVPPDELPRVTEFWRLLYEDPAWSSQRFEARLADRQGRTRFGIISAKLIPGTGNCVVSVTDITELRKADDKLRMSENLYRTIFRTTSTATAILSGDGTVLLANAEVEPLLGYPPFELEGKAHWSSFIPPDELPRLTEYFRLLREDPASATQHYEARITDRWGAIKHGIFSVALIPGSRNSVISIMDITGLKKAEAALRESEEKYRTLVERAGDAIVVIQEGRVRFCNSRAAEAWGGVPENIAGKLFTDFVAPEEVVRIGEINRRRMAGEPVPQMYDTILLRKDGSRFHAGINSGVITYLEKPAVLVFMRDITERKKSEEALITAHRKLNLLSSITRHDIRNQLTVILGYTELLRQEAATGPSERIVRAIEEAARTIQHQIEFTREYQEVGIRAPVWQDMSEVVARAGERLDPGNVELVIQLGGVELFADPLLERAFYNLIGNAVQHGERLTRVRFTAAESPAGLAVTCEDDGVGIPAGEKERVFHPGFSRSGGYGLFLVREILGITGISIHEEGVPGEGARFVISAPAGTWRKRHRPQA